MAKIFSLLLRVRINKWCETNSVFNDCHYAFRGNCSTADAVFILHTPIQKILATNKKLWCIFTDYERAFDTVNRHALWTKLIRTEQNRTGISTGLSCKMVNMIKAIYANVQSCVKLSYNNTVSISDFFEVTISLKQGEPLFPILFMLFINDISSTIDYNCLTQDDLILFATYREDLFFFFICTTNVHVYQIIRVFVLFLYFQFVRFNCCVFDFKNEIKRLAQEHVDFCEHISTSIVSLFFNNGTKRWYNL